MKKIFAIVWALALVFGVSIATTSCKKDDNGSGSSTIEKILGNWHLSSIKVTVAGSTTEMTVNEAKSLIESMAGTGNISFIDEYLYITETTINGLPYTLKGNSFTQYFGEEISGWKLTIKNIKADSFVLHADFGSSLTEDLIYVRTS